MMENKGKTIKQIADEIGVSKQAIQKRLNRKPLCTSIQPYIYTENGTKYIDKIGENIVINAFKNNQNNKYTNSGIDIDIDLDVDKSKDVDSNVYTVLKASIETLQSQLEIKDKQIEAQSATIENLSSALNAAQALHAGTIQNQLITDGTDKPTIKDRLKYLFKGER